MTLEDKIDTALTATSAPLKCLRKDCYQPAMQGLSQWDIGKGLCVQHRTEHLERERQAKRDEEARIYALRMKKREEERADFYAMHRFIGKCKACGTTTSVLAQYTSRLVGAITGTEWFYITDQGERLATSKLTQGPTIPCRQCGKMIHPKQVKGVYKADEECGAKCQSAKGPNCDCKCKGLNHGKAWGG